MKPGFSATDILQGIINFQHELHKNINSFLRKGNKFLHEKQFVRNETEIVQHIFRNAVSILTA
jgi:hypothetical protein